MKTSLATPEPEGSGPVAREDMAPAPVSLLDPALSFAADILDDIERVRTANENRLRQMTRSVEDKDGEVRGFGYDESHPDVARLAAMVETFKKVEHEATLSLQRKMRKHPLGAWVKAQRGVGEKQGARLLAAIGDPYINSAKDAPRTVSALWAYCGLHVLRVDQSSSGTHASLVDSAKLPGGQPPRGTLTASAVGSRDTDQFTDRDQSCIVGVAAKRRKGERANWSTRAKMRAYLIAESCIKQLSPDCRGGHGPTDAQSTDAAPVQDPQDRGGQGVPGIPPTDATLSCACSPYRVVYDQRRAHTATTHPEWTDGHSHNDALRVASKEILKDLWRAARDWHLKQADMSPP